MEKNRIIDKPIAISQIFEHVICKIKNMNDGKKIKRGHVS